MLGQFVIYISLESMAWEVREKVIKWNERYVQYGFWCISASAGNEQWGPCSVITVHVCLSAYVCLRVCERERESERLIASDLRPDGGMLSGTCSLLTFQLRVGGLGWCSHWNACVLHLLGPGMWFTQTPERWVCSEMVVSEGGRVKWRRSEHGFSLYHAQWTVAWPVHLRFDHSGTFSLTIQTLSHYLDKLGL